MPGMKLPTGLMLTARNDSDKRLLAAALSIEKLLEHDPEKCERFSEKRPCLNKRPRDGLT